MKNGIAYHAFLASEEEGEVFRRRRYFIVEHKGRRKTFSKAKAAQAAQSLQPASQTEVPAAKKIGRGRMRNAAIGVEVALERHDRLSALVIANRNWLPDEVRAGLGLGAALSPLEIARRAAVLETAKKVSA